MLTNVIIFDIPNTAYCVLVYQKPWKLNFCCNLRSQKNGLIKIVIFCYTSNLDIQKLVQNINLTLNCFSTFIIVT